VGSSTNWVLFGNNKVEKQATMKVSQAVQGIHSNNQPAISLVIAVASFQQAEKQWREQHLVVSY